MGFDGEQKFLEGAVALDLPVEASNLVLFNRYFRLLEKWNKIYNLTGIKNTATWWTHHFLDCLAIEKHLPGNSLIDVGSGAGFPGVVLAITNPDKQVTLLDSSQKKCAFLREVVADLHLANLEVVLIRAEDFNPGKTFSCVVSRAFSSLNSFLDKTSHLCKEEGFLVAMKGRVNRLEIKSLPLKCMSRVVPLDIPFLQEERHLVFMTPMRQKVRV